MEGSWGHLGPRGPQEDPKSQKRPKIQRLGPSQEPQSWEPKSTKIDKHRDQHFFDRFLVDFGLNLDPKIEPKSIQKLIKQIIKSLIFFWIHFYRSLKDFRPLKSSKIEFSCKREFNFHNFEIWFQNQFLSDFGPKLGPKIDQTSTNNRLNIDQKSD